MATKINIPIAWIKGRRKFDINNFIRGRQFTVLQRQSGQDFFAVTVEENLTAAQKTALADALQQNLNVVLYDDLR